MCLDDVCYLILTELHTNQYRDLIDKKSHLRPIYLSCSLLRVYTKSCEDFKLTNMSLPIIERYDNWMRQFLILSDPTVKVICGVGDAHNMATYRPFLRSGSVLFTCVCSRLSATYNIISLGLCVVVKHIQVINHLFLALVFGLHN